MITTTDESASFLHTEIENLWAHPGAVIAITCNRRRAAVEESVLAYIKVDSRSDFVNTRRELFVIKRS